MATLGRMPRPNVLNNNYAGLNSRRVHDESSLFLQKMMRLPPNRNCADCQAPSPKFVNLELRTFICESCAKIHSEFQKKNPSVKYVPSSSFSKNEISRMKHANAGNEAVNSFFLARYDPKNRETHVHPNENSDPQIRKSWIYFKYIKRSWCVQTVVKKTQNENSANVVEKKIQSSSSNPLRQVPSLPSKSIAQHNLFPAGNAQMRDRQIPQNTFPRSRSDSASSSGSPMAIHVPTPDIILRIRSKSSNKRCADCATKSPRFLNITLKSFICSPCAQIHTTHLSHRVVEVGNYEFTPSDVQRMSGHGGGNERLNAMYLALYDPVKEVDTPPNGGSSLTYRLSWMMQKYVVKKWYSDENLGRSLVAYDGPTNPYDSVLSPSVVQRFNRNSQQQDLHSLSSQSSNSRRNPSLDSRTPLHIRTRNSSQEYEIDLNRNMRPPLAVPHQDNFIRSSVGRKEDNVESRRIPRSKQELEVDFNTNARLSRKFQGGPQTQRNMVPSQKPQGIRQKNGINSEKLVSMVDLETNFRKNVPASRSLPLDASFRFNPVVNTRIMASNQISKQQQKDYPSNIQKGNSHPLESRYRGASFGKHSGDSSVTSRESLASRNSGVRPIRMSSNPTYFNRSANNSEQELEVDFNSNMRRSRMPTLNEKFRENNNGAPILSNLPEELIGHGRHNELPVRNRDSFSNEDSSPKPLVPSINRKDKFSKQKKVSFMIPDDQDSKASDRETTSKNPQDPEFSNISSSREKERMKRRLATQRKPKIFSKP